MNPGRTDNALPERLLLDVQNAARLLSISVRRCWKLIHDGTLSSLKLGRRRLVPRSELVRLIERQLATDRP